MKLPALTTVFATALLALGPGRVQASTMPIGSNLYAGTISGGESGTIDLYDALQDHNSGALSGYLAPNTSVVFDYNIQGAVPASYYSDIDDSVDGRFAYVQYNTDASGNGYNFRYGSAPFVFAAANVSDFTSVITITNKSTATAYFNLDYDNNNALGHKTDGITSISASYSVSALPLPPAAGLFLGAMIGLYGFSACRKKRAG